MPPPLTTTLHSTHYSSSSLCNHKNDIRKRLPATILDTFLQIYLLIEDVERQQTEGIMALQSARGTKLVEGAFGHAREDVDHRVNTLSLLHLSVLHNL